MNIANFPNYYNLRQSAPMDPLVSMLNGKAEGGSLEAAQRALMDAKDRLDQQRDEQIEGALDGYRALRARQTSYENGLAAQRQSLEDFQALSGRYDALSEELASATRADCEACAGDGDASALPQDLRPALRVSALENQLAAVERGISTLVDQANRYASGQRQYAAYLEKTGQGGYAAFEYQGQPAYTRENFASETADMIGRMEAGADQWRERVSSYCGEYGMTPYDFECYLQERHKLTDAYFAAQQRLSALLAAPDAAGAQPIPRAAGKSSFDTVEISGQRCKPSQAAAGKAPDSTDPE